jgi:hypothetical protein
MHSTEAVTVSVLPAFIQAILTALEGCKHELPPVAYPFQIKPPTVRDIGSCRFIEAHDEDSIPSGCEGRGTGRREDYVGLQSGVRLLWRSIVCTVIDVGHNE